MTIITGSQFRANQGKYIGLAHNGERVILSSKKGYAELKPVAKDDKEINDYIQSKSFMAVARRIENESKKGETLRFNTIQELRSHLDSL